jgi:hypothetical protein
LVNIVPIFVAVLVWLTRILFIGALSVAGEQLFQQTDTQPAIQRQPQRQNLPVGQPLRETQSRPRVVKQPNWSLPETDEMPAFMQNRPARSQQNIPQRRRGQTRQVEMGVAGMSAAPRQYD